MIEEVLKDPTKITATLLLVIAIAGFFREWVVPGTRYTRDLAAKDKQIDKLEATVAKLESERGDLKAMLARAIEITERTQRVRGAAEGNT